MKFKHKGKHYEAMIIKANARVGDANGNTTLDIAVNVDGEQFRESLAFKGFRKIKTGYRTQAVSHAYSEEQTLEDLKAAIIALNPEEPKQVTSVNKLAVHGIRTHIIEILSDDETFVVSEQLDNVCESFYNWYGEYERRRTPNLQEAFKEWLMCLPSNINATPYTHEQEELLNKWLGVPDKEYGVDAINHKYYALVFREFNKLCTLNGVDNLFTRL